MIPDYREYQDQKLSVLLPCPFCGWDQPTIFEETEIEGEPVAAFVQCLECGANLAHGGYEPRREAIAAWNRRTDATMKETSAILDIQRPMAHDTLVLRGEFDRHERKECACAKNECAGNLYAVIRKMWPVRGPAILKNQGRG